MDIRKILKYCDHTLLSQSATFEDIKGVLNDAVKYSVASACIPPCFVKEAKEYVGEKLKICTVIGFPNGYNTTSCKVFETVEAIKDGADDIDMVINIGKLKEKDYSYVLNEIKLINAECIRYSSLLNKKITLKVIVETCLLSEEEKIKVCELVTEAGADYIKTSTGFSAAGATKEDIILFSKHIGENVKMKAAGGISSLKDAEDFISLGAERLGTSRIVKIAKREENK